MVTDQDKRNFAELPYELRLVILKDFCYPNFLKKFSRYFQFRPFPGKGIDMKSGANGADKSPNNEFDTVSKYSERPIWTRFKKFPFMTLEDNTYSNFITSFLVTLEPRRFKS